MKALYPLVANNGVFDVDCQCSMPYQKHNKIAFTDQMLSFAKCLKFPGTKAHVLYKKPQVLLALIIVHFGFQRNQQDDETDNPDPVFHWLIGFDCK